MCIPRLIVGLLASLLLVCQQSPGQVDDYVAAWPFDEGVGQTTADIGPHGFDGVLHGAAWTGGILGNALAFDGLDDYAELTDGSGHPDLIGDLAEGTVSLWFRFDSVPGTNLVHPLLYLGSDEGGPDHSGLLIEIGHFSDNTRLYFTIHDGDGQNPTIPLCFDTGFDLEIGEWYHFAAVVGDGFNTGYLNGVELTDRHYNFGTSSHQVFFADLVSPEVLWIGKGFLSTITTEQYHEGVVDEVRVYDRPLTADDVADYYQSVVDALEVTIESPDNGGVLWGPVTVTGTSQGASGVGVSIDGSPFEPADGVDPWTNTFDASQLSPTNHEIIARAQDGSGGTTDASVFVIVNAESPPTPECSEIVPGTPLPFANGAAPEQLRFTAGSTVYVEIIGHSENRGYHTPLQALLDADPPGGFRYVVTNHFIGGHETWRWVTPGERGYQAVEDIINTIQGPTIALILTSNNTSFPAAEPDLSDPNYALFVEQTEQLADHLYNAGDGVDSCYFSAHRMKPQNLMPCWYENLAIGDLMASAEGAGKGFIDVGPEQHQLHWCCYPDCYAADFSHTNSEGDDLMAEAWFTLLSTRIGVCEADLDADGQVNTQDFLAFLNLWNAGDPEADWTGDGTVNTLDFLAYLADWSAGCG